MKTDPDWKTRIRPDHPRIFINRDRLPEIRTLEKVDGPGREFVADGVNYAIDAGPSKLIEEVRFSTL